MKGGRGGNWVLKKSHLGIEGGGLGYGKKKRLRKRRRDIFLKGRKN